MRTEFKRKIKDAISIRARKSGGRRCEECGALLSEGEGEIDHTIPEWMRSATPKADRRALTENDGRLLCRACHVQKSREEARIRKRVDRAARRHAGKIKPKFKGWRNFRGEPVWARDKRMRPLQAGLEPATS